MIFSSDIISQNETKSRDFQTKVKKTANFSLNMFGNTKKGVNLHRRLIVRLFEDSDIQSIYV